MSEQYQTAAADAPIATAQQPLPGMPATPGDVTPHPALIAVISGVQAADTSHNWATTAASVLQALMPVLQPALQVSRASSKTSAEIAIGIAALSGILSVFFPHPNAQ